MSLTSCRVPATSSPTGDVDVAAVAALLGDPRRARILLALCSGDELTAGRLAEHTRVSAQATSAHLAKLLDAGLVTVRPVGRHRYYRIRGREVVDALEALARLAPAAPVRSLRDDARARSLRYARVCYDHLAGRLGVHLADGLVDSGAVHAGRPDAIGDVAWTPGQRAREVFGALGVPAHRIPDGGPLHPCLDWSAGRPHLSGALGAALLASMLDDGRLRRVPGQRAVRLTAAGERCLREVLGTDPPPLGTEPDAVDISTGALAPRR